MRVAGRFIRFRTVLAALAVLPILVSTLTSPVGAAIGGLDPTFDGDGKVVSDLGSDERANGVAVQPDGRIVVAGTGCGGDFLVARYRSDGSLDPSFDGDGWTCVDGAGGSADQGAEVVVLGDGRLLVAGTSAGNFALARLTAGGAPDQTFGSGGRAVYELGGNEVLRDVAVGPDGTIVMVGETTGPGCALAPTMAGTTAGLAVVRVAPEGALDPSFGTAGRYVQISDTLVRRGFAVAVDPSGRPVVSGHTSTCTRVAIDSFVSRLTATGQEDPTFVAANVLNEPGPDSAVDLAIQPDGRIVVLVDTFVGPATSPARDDAMTVVRYNPDGSPDGSFGTGGVATALFGVGRNASGAALVLQPDGGIVAGGSVDGDFALARFTASGAVDDTVVTDLGGNDVVTGLAVQPDGKLVAAGFSDGNLALARYATAGTVTTSSPTTTSTSTSTTAVITTTTTLAPSPFASVCALLHQLTEQFRRSTFLRPFAPILERVTATFCGP